MTTKAQRKDRNHVKPLFFPTFISARTEELPVFYYSFILFQYHTTVHTPLSVLPSPKKMSSLHTAYPPDVTFPRRKRVVLCDLYGTRCRTNVRNVCDATGLDITPRHTSLHSTALALATREFLLEHFQSLLCKSTTSGNMTATTAEIRKISSNLNVFLTYFPDQLCHHNLGVTIALRKSTYIAQEAVHIPLYLVRTSDCESTSRGPLATPAAATLLVTPPRSAQTYSHTNTHTPLARTVTR